MGLCRSMRAAQGRPDATMLATVADRCESGGRGSSKRTPVRVYVRFPWFLMFFCWVFAGFLLMFPALWPCSTPLGAIWIPPKQYRRGVLVELLAEVAQEAFSGLGWPSSRSTMDKKRGKSSGLEPFGRLVAGTAHQEGAMWGSLSL